jgi:hypothetical protein
MKKLNSLLLAVIIFFSTASAQSIRLKNDNLNLVVSGSGQISEIADPSTNKNYLAAGQQAPLLKIRVANEWEESNMATFSKDKNTITLSFPSAKVAATIKVTQNKTHFVFELIQLSSKNKVNAVIWGPYPTSINKTIGEVIGVVRDGEFGIGIQCLNTKTIGGVLKNSEGADDSRGSVAIKQEYGSSLQAFSLDRSKPRKIKVWGENYPDMPVDAIQNETTIGSKIALFGCPEKEILSRIGTIELKEGLPHPMINGDWIKQSPETGRAYLISDFNEANIDEMIAYTNRAGLASLYHEGPFQSWGHFILDPKSFPNGNAGMKACVDKAAKIGLHIGVHTLSSFINTNDPYITPIPDKRLALTGSSTLSEAIDSAANEITVESNQYFKNTKPSTLHAVMIGEEIIRFREVTSLPPYKLLDCRRGAFGTKAAIHKKGEIAGMMLDYPYQTLFPNFELQQEIAGNLGRFFSETGVSHMDFDGHEGCISSGEGDYAMQAFAEKVFRETNHTLVNGTSRSSHYYWHICHYWNWGEPWYGGFRESQGDYRLENQPFLERNYMPNMLGWFLLSATTTQEDIEWMMARAAGYNAGFAMVASHKSLQKNPNTNQLLDLIKLWQDAYKNKIFSNDQIARLKNPETDFHLVKTATEWKLYPFKKYKFEHTKLLLQPGQPTFSEWKFENKDAKQPLTFNLTVMGKEGKINNPWIELDGYYKLELPGEFRAGYSIVCDGEKLKLYDEKGSFNKEIALSKPIPVLTEGEHTVKFDCEFSDENQLKIRSVFKTIRNPEIIRN